MIQGLVNTSGHSDNYGTAPLCKGAEDVIYKSQPMNYLDLV